MGKYLLVFGGGGLGSLTRFAVARTIAQRIPPVPFATGTFVINVTGSFLIGLLMILIVERFQLDPRWHLFLVVGCLGGYTTFSSFEYDAYLATRSGHGGVALLYLISSVAAGYGAVWLGAELVGKRG